MAKNDYSTLLIVLIIIWIVVSIVGIGLVLHKQKIITGHATAQVMVNVIPPPAPPVPPVPPPEVVAPRLTICAEEWNCTDWGSCLPNGTQFRHCWDLNKCEGLYNQRIVTQIERAIKPDEVRACEYISPPSIEKPSPLFIIITPTVIINYIILFTLLIILFIILFYIRYMVNKKPKKSEKKKQKIKKS
ncbi:hypothetical protein GOV06_05265 [Candidatus Woesearchaeota archaeon]|nr:hypothetical protein [Candidatus Woesearchaeota archaeon]